MTITAPDDNAVFQIYEPDAAVGRDADGLLEFKGTPLHGAPPRRLLSDPARVWG